MVENTQVLSTFTSASRLISQSGNVDQQGHGPSGIQINYYFARTRQKGLKNVKTQRYAALDGLRGWAAFAVVLSHVAAMTWIPYLERFKSPALWEKALWSLGAPAVDVFFVLSGYVVSKAIIEREKTYGKYLLSRMIRLYPVAWCAVILGLFARYVVQQQGFETTALNLLKKPLEPNDVMGIMTLVAPIPNADKINPPLWTLVVEMQVAMVMPILATIALKKPKLLAISGVYVPMILAYLFRNDYWFLFSGFMIGAALYGMKQKIPQAPKPNILFAFFLVGLMARTITGLDDPMMRIPCAIAAAGVILAVKQGAGNRFLENKISSFLGRISYPLYAVHWPIMAMTVSLIGNKSFITIISLASVTITFFIAWIISRVVDENAIALSKILKGEQ